MTRTEIITTFRSENPEITERVLLDERLYSWLLQGNIYISCETRCIQGSASFTTEEGTDNYNLLSGDYAITNFYSIDEYPGGGVAYDDDRLTEATIAELDADNPNWRTADNGTPEKYYLRNGILYFDCPPDDEKTVDIYTILLPNDFDNDDEEPFNELAYLKPFHYSLVLYLQMKAMNKVGKQGDDLRAERELREYLKWMKKEIGGLKYGKIYLKKKN